MNNFLRLLFLIILSATLIKAQTPTQLNASEIQQGLNKLNTLGSVLYIAAHPDDENTRLLAYMANEKKLRTAYLSLTRGDGGQNLIGKEQGEALGLIRTQELLAARSVDGAEQFFTRAHDFGFSKNPHETFGFWNHDSILSDVVLCIRRFKPDVIICRFPTTGEGGHGHHTASAILALEAFDAAADSTKFKWQLKSTTIWKAKSIYWNTFNFGEINTINEKQLKIDAGLYNPLLGKSYGELASESRSMHKSQGFGTLLERGSGMEYFKYLKGDSVKKDLFENINITWSRLNTTGTIQKQIENCIKSFKPESTEKSVNQLTEIYNSIKALKEINSDITYWKQQKLKETERLLLACAGIWLEALSNDFSVVPGNSIKVNTQILNRSNCPVVLKKINFWLTNDSTLELNLKNNQLYSFKHQITVSKNIPYSNPYWLSTKIENNLHQVSNAALIGTAQNQAALKVTFSLMINNQLFDIERDVVYKYSNPAKGEIYRPLEILPEVVINLPRKNYVFTDNKAKTIQLTLKAITSNVSGVIEIANPVGFTVKLTNTAFSLKNKNDEAIIELVITPLQTNAKAKLSITAKTNNGVYTQNLRRIEYDHIPYRFILTEAQLNLTCFDLKKNSTNIGYINGAGDELETCLMEAGYTVTRINDELLAKGDLSVFDAIVTGVRAYNINERLQINHNRLMNYVNNGGNLIVQYNTNNISPQVKIGPYPFVIGKDRVTDEKAEVKFVNSNLPVLNQPNNIGVNDFKDWIQERGTYFATDLNENYVPVFLMNDADEKPLNGSLIIGKYGKGNFVYTGLAFFRQLPAGVIGAYRLFANLIDLPENK